MTAVCVPPVSVMSTSDRPSLSHRRYRRMRQTYRSLLGANPHYQTSSPQTSSPQTSSPQTSGGEATVQLQFHSGERRHTVSFPSRMKGGHLMDFSFVVHALWTSCCRLVPSSPFPLPPPLPSLPLLNHLPSASSLPSSPLHHLPSPLSSPLRAPLLSPLSSPLPRRCTNGEPVCHR